MWLSAMQEEFQALQQQCTWDLVSLPSHKTAIGCKWVYRIKRNYDGSVARYKARLVAKGYLQQEGVDFHETFSPVAKQPTIRIFLCLALHFQWPIHQLDISNAFLHGTFDEEVYMLQPPGFVHDSNQVCKLKKALYGLKQDSRAWYSTFSKFLISQGFINSHSDSSLFVQHTNTSLIILVVYVDDILVTGSDSSLLTQFIHHMHTVFSMKELGPVSYFLGISVQSLPHGYFLSQAKYATELLYKSGLTNCKPCSTPLAVKPSFPAVDALPFSNPSLYRSLVGGLQYLTITRPDLALDVN